MSHIWPMLVILFLTACLYFFLKTGGFIDNWRDRRHGLAVDGTEEWQNFEETFRGNT